jgi:exonuclease-1
MLTDGHVRRYAGRRVAVDGYSWLHKGAYACARELAQGRKSDMYVCGCGAGRLASLSAHRPVRFLTRYVKYCMKRIALLLENNVKPLIVLDGAYLPSKAGKEQERLE